ncbi:MAG: hypothetical protein NTY09_13390 [bacterium]|nr:hypothetical protein [bacterium]
MEERDEYSEDLSEIEKTPSIPGAAKDEGEIPPPPGDWVSHPITRTIGVLILLALIALGIWKGPEIIDYIKAHSYGSGIVGFVIAMVVAIISFAYWKYRAVGDVGMRYWDTDRKKRKT